MYLRIELPKDITLSNSKRESKLFLRYKILIIRKVSQIFDKIPPPQ